ncbi:hypothetical protein [Chitinophaga sp. XS-30]|uniref:hypothetical protein n=1 Tax=Chitinophaga sp. XS-30 TaxID=2604421 RepID=UPI0011DE3BEE|nr:hypothetical protein [Chitinophaga sp. XS-30]QEH39643.1 hypothetical protein FW415_01675 [Chitinophaga sp. XS-30]
MECKFRRFFEKTKKFFTVPADAYKRQSTWAFAAAGRETAFCKGAACQFSAACRKRAGYSPAIPGLRVAPEYFFL